MYLVISFDFGGNSDVKLHCLSKDGLVAKNTYDDVLKDIEEYNKKYEGGGIKKLLDLIKVPDEFTEKTDQFPEPITFFWTPKSQTYSQVIASNN